MKVDKLGISKKVGKYIKNALLDMIEHGVEVKLVKNYVHAGVFESFDGLYFVCRITDDIEDWFPIFIHEYCHFQQWKEGKYSLGKWEEYDRNFTKWLGGKIKLSREKGRFYAAKMRAAEIDCEKRTVREIKKHKFDIDIDEYIKHANAYIYSYAVLAEKGRWYRESPGDVPEIFDMMPNKFLTRYDKLPKGYRKLIEGLYKKKKKS